MWWKRLFLICAVLLISTINSWAVVSIPFDGNIDFVEGKLTASINGAGQDIQIEFARKSKYHFKTSLRLQPLKIHSLELKSDVDIHLKQAVVNGEVSSTRLGMQSQYTLLNGKPLKDLVGDMEWRDDKLLIHLLSLGQFSIQGSVTPQSDKPLDIVIEWDDVLLEPALNMTRPVEKHVVAEGVASGQLRVNGEWRKPRLQGLVSTYHGFIDDFTFDSINFRFEGHYPVIDVTEAILNRPGKVTGNLTGEVDLTDLSTFITQFKALKKAPIIHHQDENEVGWVYKRITAENDLGKSVSEMQYFIRKEEALGRDDGRQGGMLGVERRFDF